MSLNADVFKKNLEMEADIDDSVMCLMRYQSVSETRTSNVDSTFSTAQMMFDTLENETLFIRGLNAFVVDTRVHRS